MIHTLLDVLFLLCVFLEAIGVGHAKIKLGWLGLSFFALGLVIS
jgi:hypothetical protein